MTKTFGQERPGNVSHQYYVKEYIFRLLIEKPRKPVQMSESDNIYLTPCIWNVSMNICTDQSNKKWSKCWKTGRKNEMTTRKSVAFYNTLNLKIPGLCI